MLPRIDHYFKHDLKGKTFAIWGLAFKPETDDIREAPSLYIIEELLSKGVIINVFDPEAMPNIRKIFGDSLNYMINMYDGLKEADALVICTEWSLFRTQDFNRIKTS